MVYFIMLPLLMWSKNVMLFCLHTALMWANCVFFGNMTGGIPKFVHHAATNWSWGARKGKPVDTSNWWMIACIIISLASPCVHIKQTRRQTALLGWCRCIKKIGSTLGARISVLLYCTRLTVEYSETFSIKDYTVPCSYGTAYLFDAPTPTKERAPLNFPEYFLSSRLHNHILWTDWFIKPRKKEACSTIDDQYTTPVKVLYLQYNLELLLDDWPCNLWGLQIRAWTRVCHAIYTRSKLHNNWPLCWRQQWDWWVGKCLIK